MSTADRGICSKVNIIHIYRIKDGELSAYYTIIAKKTAKMLDLFCLMQ